MTSDYKNNESKNENILLYWFKKMNTEVCTHANSINSVRLESRRSAVELRGKILYVNLLNLLLRPFSQKEY